MDQGCKGKYPCLEWTRGFSEHPRGIFERNVLGIQGRLTLVPRNGDPVALAYPFSPSKKASASSQPEAGPAVRKPPCWRGWRESAPTEARGRRLAKAKKKRVRVTRCPPSQRSITMKGRPRLRRETRGQSRKAHRASARSSPDSRGSEACAMATFDGCSHRGVRRVRAGTVRDVGTEATPLARRPGGTATGALPRGR